MLKKIYYKKKNLQFKNKFLSKLFFKRLNFNSILRYSFFYFFMHNEKLILNKKVLWSLYSTEKGSIFSLKKWFKFIIFKYY
uniref:ribosomal protein L20 n=1 Tax=Hypnea wynnei TaxID=1867777 RepID=UPI003002ECDE|nr:ribosomal protein L20 [Hypnea wynnei]